MKRWVMVVAAILFTLIGIAALQNGHRLVAVTQFVLGAAYVVRALRGQTVTPPES